MIETSSSIDLRMAAARAQLLFHYKNSKKGDASKDFCHKLLRKGFTRREQGQNGEHAADQRRLPRLRCSCAPCKASSLSDL